MNNKLRSLPPTHFQAALLIALLTLSGCGGGGGNNSTTSTGSGTPTNTNIDFKLFPGNYFTNYDVSASLTGSDNSGNSYTGSSSEQTLATTMFLGENAIPVQSSIDFTASNGGFASVVQSQYFGTNPSDIRFLGVDGIVATVSAMTNTIPPTAKIGDSGTAGTYTDNGGSVTISTWQLEDGFNGNASLVFLNSTSDQGVLDNTFTTTYLIQPDGTRLSIELKTFNVNVNLEVTLSGSY